MNGITICGVGALGALALLLTSAYDLARVFSRFSGMEYRASHGLG